MSDYLHNKLNHYGWLLSHGNHLPSCPNIWTLENWTSGKNDRFLLVNFIIFLFRRLLNCQLLNSSQWNSSKWINCRLFNGPGDDGTTCIDAKLEREMRGVSSAKEKSRFPGIPNRFSRPQSMSTCSQTRFMAEEKFSNPHMISIFNEFGLNNAQNSGNKRN